MQLVELNRVTVRMAGGGIHITIPRNIREYEKIELGDRLVFYRDPQTQHLILQKADQGKLACHKLVR